MPKKELCDAGCGNEATVIVEMDFGDLPMCRDCSKMYVSSESYLNTIDMKYGRQDYDN